MSILKKALTVFTVASVLFSSNILAVSAAELENASNSIVSNNVKAPAGHPEFSGPVPANYQHPSGQPVQPGTINNDPHNDPAYGMGFKEGYNVGYRETYQLAYQNGLRSGEINGYENGVKEGISRFNSKYYNYNYTSEELSNLIKKINIGGRGVIDEIETVSNKKSEKFGPAHHGNNPNYTMGFNDGIIKGRYDGRNDGERDGSKVTYPAAFDRGFVEGTRRADINVHYDSTGKLLTIEDQYAIAMEAFSRGDYNKATFRFNVILVEEPINGQFRNKAFWYAGLAKMNNGEKETALSIFIVYNLQFPETMKEETTLNIAKLLMEIKTGGFIGIGSTKHFDKAKCILEWWISSFESSKQLPEAYFKLGECYEKLKDTNNAVLTYKKIVDIYPGTTIAEDAKKRIKAISSWWPWD